MVTKTILSHYSSSPPTEAGRVKIATGGPLYALADVQALAADELNVFLWTSKCIRDVQNLFDDDLAQVAELILCLKAPNYIDSEWCDNGKNALAACDAYSIRRVETTPATGKRMAVEYFLKFAIGKTGRLVLMVSCHV